MTDEYLKIIVYLENTLADYYAKIKNLTRLKGARNVLEFMEAHSVEHANIIAELKNSLQKPTLHQNAVVNFQNNLVKSVFGKIANEENILTVLQTLADAEESVGKLYLGISGHLVKLSEYYRNIAAEIDRIAHEEFNHRDLLLRDKSRLASKIVKG